jgi:hypothetical protein
MAALQLGVGGEEVAQLPAVRFSPDQGLARDLLFDLADGLVSPTGSPSGPALGIGGAAGLCELVRASATVERRANTLCKALAKVDKAAAAGKLEKRTKLVASFRTKLDKEVGKSLSGDDAAMLGRLSYLLLDEQGIVF